MYKHSICKRKHILYYILYDDDLGPKVVLCSDASMSCGLSKELLLRWGGDPRCRVIFTGIL